MIMPAKEVEYQYFMNNLKLKQFKNQKSGAISIQLCSLDIRSNASRYQSEFEYTMWLRNTRTIEQFMC